MAAYTALTTLTLQKSGGVETMTLTRRSDGSFSFVNKNGRTVTVHGDEDMKALFDALAALDV